MTITHYTVWGTILVKHELPSHPSHISFYELFFLAPSQILSRFMIIKISLRLVEEIISSCRSLLIDEKRKLHLEAPRHLHFQSTLFQSIN
jgi:hypothetical protein